MNYYKSGYIIELSVKKDNKKYNKALSEISCLEKEILVMCNYRSYCRASLKIGGKGSVLTSFFCSLITHHFLRFTHHVSISCLLITHYSLLLTHHVSVS